MPTEDPPDADPGTPEGRRVVELLWAPTQQSPVRGPKPRTSLSEVVAAGVEIADAEGLAALSMRKVASRLGIGAMSLYTYVPGRSELVELMIDRVYASTPSQSPSCHGGSGSKPGLEKRGASMARTRGCWITTWPGFRSARTFSTSPRRSMPRCIDAGFAGAENVAISNLIQWQLLGAARSMISDADEARHTGVSAEAYWDSRASFWGTYFDWNRYPNTAAIWEAGGFDDPAGWDFERMLDRLLTGIEQPAAVSPERETRVAPTARRGR